MESNDRLIHADRLARDLSSQPCRHPVEDPNRPGDFENCGEIFVCGGICAPCSARRYVERYPDKFDPEVIQ